MTDSVLLPVLAAGQDRGFVGPGDLAPHLAQAEAFAALLPPGAGLAVDLGAGGGLPALPAALAAPTWRWLLVEAQLRRVDFLGWAVGELGLTGRVEVRHARAEAVGRDPAVRGTAQAVTARSFGPPAVVAECAAPLLEVGGYVIVSDPPEGAGDRWPERPLGDLGLVVSASVAVSAGHFTVLRQAEPCSDRYPRRAGVPGRRPLF